MFPRPIYSESWEKYDNQNVKEKIKRKERRHFSFFDVSSKRIIKICCLNSVNLKLMELLNKTIIGRGFD